MFGQSFVPADLGTVGFLIVLEALLSADNALVLAIMVRHLPGEERRKALLYGLGGAFALRTIAILLAAYIIAFWWLQAVGALYLLILPIKHFADTARGGHQATGKRMGFWATVVYLNLVDTAFALDSVIVAVAVVDTVRNPGKLWVVIAGAVLGIVILRFAAGYFIRLLERYPVLDHVAYLLVGWAGVKLLFISGHSYQSKDNPFQPVQLPFAVPELPSWLFWTGMAVIAIGGTLVALRHERPISEQQEADADEIESATGVQFDQDEPPISRAQ